MSLRQRLEEDLHEAMRSGDTVRRSILRLVRSAAHNEEIARGKELDDGGLLEVIAREAKRHKESIEQFRRGNRADLVAQEEAELGILLGYLPQQLTLDELRELAQQAIQEVGAQGPADMGKVMGRLMPQVRGRAQGAEVSAVVRGLLQSGG